MHSPVNSLSEHALFWRRLLMYGVPLDSGMNSEVYKHQLTGPESASSATFSGVIIPEFTRV